MNPLEVVRAHLPAWREVREARITEISGGITNLLRRVDAEGLDPVLVRFFGPETERVIDRASEDELFQRLAALDLAPPYLGRFEGGRIEGFLEGFRPLEPHEMGPLRALIAPELRRMHEVPAAGPSRLWRTLGSWMDQAVALKPPFDLTPYAEALAEMRSNPPRGRGEGGAAATRVVLAHNDLLSGNILFNGQRVRFIDFEYGASAPAAFDVANHFCEYAGFDSDFERGFPSREVREDFARHYLGSSAGAADFTDVVDAYVLADHLWWGSWAVLQANFSPIDFDFMEYARLRFAGFDLHRVGL